MSKKTARKGDPTDHGGVILTGSPTRTASGKEVARVDDDVSCPIHGPTKIVEGSGTVFADGKKVARVGDKCACGATITDGDATVLTGD